MPVKDTDRGAAKLVQRLVGLRDAPPRATVGVHQAEGAAPHPGSGTSVASVALALEVGTAERPAVGWLGGAVAAEGSKLGGDLVRAGAAILEGASPKDALRPVLQDLVDGARALAPSRTGTVRDAISGAVDGERVTR